MENDVVNLYVNKGYSISQLCKEFGVGKLRIKGILEKNIV